ncbi:hypothetical protein CMQ_1236 [Grosmannia clavigera kw1407]|uniref:Uncharacterized protein n=1 Tax=Grosmannia clavigera (strain kw1407 / UAMH 11150) TaxID=655863 RepID=F0XD36_GROCL|nr:uncharacterized protein CMQ_1236 [Grosmannia clavigera kw1407]EFX04308.1 hypothetical protein CMQ_1236 [Grosmannia clavigera kw1407]
MLPTPATSTTFSCQLSNTLMPPAELSFIPPGRPLIWLKPVCCGVIPRVGVRGPLLAGAAEEAMPLYFISTSSSSLPFSDAYSRDNSGFISLALIDCSTSTTVCIAASLAASEPA